MPSKTYPLIMEHPRRDLACGQTAPEPSRQKSLFAFGGFNLSYQPTHHYSCRRLGRTTKLSAVGLAPIANGHHPLIHVVAPGDYLAIMFNRYGVPNDPGHPFASR